MAHSGTLIYMRNDARGPKYRVLTAPLPCEDFDHSEAYVPTHFMWDGSSVPFIFRGLFPRHNHPIASCRHDWRCRRAKNAAQRKWADQQFEKDVGTTSWWITKKLGYLGVRAGALLGVGVRY